MRAPFAGRATGHGLPRLQKCNGQGFMVGFLSEVTVVQRLCTFPKKTLVGDIDQVRDFFLCLEPVLETWVGGVMFSLQIIFFYDETHDAVDFGVPY